MLFHQTQRHPGLEVANQNKNGIVRDEVLLGVPRHVFAAEQLDVVLSGERRHTRRMSLERRSRDFVVQKAPRTVFAGMNRCAGPAALASKLEVFGNIPKHPGCFQLQYLLQCANRNCLEKPGLVGQRHRMPVATRFTHQLSRLIFRVAAHFSQP